MMGPTISITKQQSGRQRFDQVIVALRNVEVLVGIPQSTSSRRGEMINSAELLYIHTHGSPVRGIPARPVIEPAIQADGNRQAIAQELRDAAAALMQGRAAESKQYLQRAGMAGMNASKAWFVDPRNHWAPNSPATVARKGSDRPLIDTGAMRRAIVWVLRGQTDLPTEAQQLEKTNLKLR
jgi:hypothetical protein